MGFYQSTLSELNELALILDCQFARSGRREERRGQKRNWYSHTNPFFPDLRNMTIDRYLHHLLNGNCIFQTSLQKDEKDKPILKRLKSWKLELTSRSYCFT